MPKKLVPFSYLIFLCSIGTEMVICCVNILFYSIISSKSIVGVWKGRKGKVERTKSEQTTVGVPRAKPEHRTRTSPKPEWRLSEEGKTHLYRRFVKRERPGGVLRESIFLTLEFLGLPIQVLTPGTLQETGRQGDQEVAQRSSKRLCSGFAGCKHKGFLPHSPTHLGKALAAYRIPSTHLKTQWSLGGAIPSREEGLAKTKPLCTGN